MKGLCVHVENYKAIKFADIELSDLTVLAGVNASGKSTIARLFHRLICIEANYERYAAEIAINQFVDDVLVPLRKAIQSADMRLWHRLRRLQHNIRNEDFKSLSRIVKFIRREIDDLYLTPSTQALLTDPRLLQALDRREGNAFEKPAPVSGVGVKSWIENALAACEAWYEKLVSRGEESAALFMLKRFPWDFFDPMVTILNSATGHTVLRCKDGDVPILDAKDLKLPFRPIFTPRQSLYIARPSVDFPVVSESSIDLNGIRYDRASQDLAVSDLHIEELMGGTIDMQKDSAEAVRGEQWQFSFSGSQKIPVLQCADGMKSMASILMLDKCGLLQSDSLLIIDEPEVHLHPRWVVEMARVLVHLAKRRKVRVLVTTHSPDMVHALRDFAENDGIGANTSFFLAKEDLEQKGLFNYENLGMNIGPIFTIFNLAKDKIVSISKEIREGAEE